MNWMAASRLIFPALGPDYARELLALLANGPPLISPKLGERPDRLSSYHAVLALLVLRFAWALRGLRWAFPLRTRLFCWRHRCRAAII